MTTSNKTYLHTAIQAAQAASKIHKHYVGGDLDIDTKSNHTDLVTQADKESEQRIREVIQKAHPDHVVLGEEYGQDGNSSHRWIVDPIDGTLNYAHGFPFYCVSIALEVDGVLEVGVVLDTTRDELFSATRGEGATCNGRPITVTKEANLTKAMLATGFAYNVDTAQENIAAFARMLPKCRSVRRPGAAALDLSYVACGRLDGFWELKLNAWDVAAGLLLIQEAGGTVTDGSGAPYRLEEKVVVASNGHLHMKMVNALELAPGVGDEPFSA